MTMNDMKYAMQTVMPAVKPRTRWGNSSGSMVNGIVRKPNVDVMMYSSKKAVVAKLLNGRCSPNVAYTESTNIEIVMPRKKLRTKIFWSMDRANFGGNCVNGELTKSGENRWRLPSVFVEDEIGENDCRDDSAHANQHSYQELVKTSAGLARKLRCVNNYHERSRKLLEGKEGIDDGQRLVNFWPLQRTEQSVRCSRASS